jgi:hypothetical protein
MSLSSTYQWLITAVYVALASGLVKSLSKDGKQEDLSTNWGIEAW